MAGTHKIITRSAILIAGVIGADIAAAAYAPPEPIKTDSTITVTGQRLDRDELRHQASAFVKTAVALPEEDQYARRRDPLCAKVSGIDIKYANLVVAKINAVADAIGVKIGDIGCKANLLVSFTTDSANYIADTQKVRLGLFSGMRPSERSALLTSPAPIR
jgi:hypothetical protein